MGWSRIHDYAAIGDCRSAVLIDRTGSIDWLCWPRFDSPAYFAALLDPERGGRFRIAPVGGARVERRYLPATNVLETTFATDGAEVRLLDLMPVADESFKASVLQPDHEVLRVISCVRGEMAVEVEFDPRPDFGLGPGRLDMTPLGLRLRSRAGDLVLRASCDVSPLAKDRVMPLHLREGESVAFSLTYSEEAPAVLRPLEEVPDAIRRSVAWWRRWAERLDYDGPWRDAVVRSALALKLLIYAPSGAVVAAPTTSLPEEPGGNRNWDYRFCWLRDASFVVRALNGLGCLPEAEAFVSWLLHSTRTTLPRLQVLYDVFGGDAPPERELPLRGHLDSRPVRVGNGARNQLQLDVYGEVLEAAAIYLRGGRVLDRETHRLLVDIGHYVCANWQLPDEGIWEVRSGRFDHTHSRVLCWVALDRLVELHDSGLLTHAHRNHFAEVRDCIRADVEAHGWSEAIQSYVAVYGGQDMDAALLLFGWYGFAACSSPRMQSTWQRVRAELGAAPSLLYRYRTHGGTREGAFGICSFWEVDFLARAGRLEEAERTFEQLLGFANDVGLYGEEIDTTSGEALGNFPQGFTHVGLVNAALSIQSARRRQEEQPSP